MVIANVVSESFAMLLSILTFLPVAYYFSGALNGRTVLTARSFLIALNNKNSIV